MKPLTRLLVVLLLLTAGVVTPACGGGNDGPASYVGHASNAAVLVKWTRSGDDLSGALTQARIDSSDPYTVATAQVSFTGKIQGAGVSLRLSQGLGVETTLTGELDGSKLGLDFPGEHGDITTVPFDKGTAEDYNGALADLRQRARHAKADADEVQAEATAREDAAVAAQTVGDDIDALQQAASEASTHATSRYADVLDQLRNDLATAKKDTQTALADASRNDDTTCSDAGTVGSDLGTIEGDIGSLESEQGATAGITTSIGAAIKRLRQDVSALYSFDARYVPADAPDQATIDAAIKDARREARKAASGDSPPTAEGHRILEQARAYEAQANAVRPHRRISTPRKVIPALPSWRSIVWGAPTA
jgi:hypothetical protein